MHDYTPRSFRAQLPREGPKLSHPQFGDSGGGLPLTKFSVIAVGTDWLTCNPYKGDDSIDTATVNYVMKPWTLRRTPFDGVTDGAGISYTYTGNAARTAMRGTITETQQITPDYSAGDIVYAVTTKESFSVSMGEVTTRFMDVNCDGRAWAHLGATGS